jgi:hypothetical protein
LPEQTKEKLNFFFMAVFKRLIVRLMPHSMFRKPRVKPSGGNPDALSNERQKIYCLWSPASALQ